MNFGEAIELMKIGRRVARTAWQGGWSIQYYPGTEDVGPCLTAITHLGKFRGWTIDCADMFADDWQEVA